MTNHEILFEDEYLIAVNKPSGLLVHPSAECRHIKESLLTDLEETYSQKLYCVNRIDRPVSGIVLLSKDKEVVTKLQSKWHTDETQKIYLALVKGIAEASGIFEFALKNDYGEMRPSKTEYETLEYFKESTLVKVTIHTGRRHQIRRHFSRRMQPLIGDRKYGRKKINDLYQENFDIGRIFLHAHSLEFTHPITEDKIIIKSELPNDLLKGLEKLKENDSNK